MATKRVGYSLGGGVGRSWCPDSEWGQTLRTASLCSRDAPGTAAPKNERPNYPVPKPPSEKRPKRGVCYSLGGGVGRSWSAGLGMGPNFVSSLRVPAGSPVHSHDQKTSAPTTPSQNRPAEKGQNGGCAIALVGGGAKLVRRTRNGAKLCERTPCARGMPRAQPRPKTSAPTTPSQNRPAEKGQNMGCAIALVGGVERSWSAGLEMGPNFASRLRVPAG